MPAAGVQVSVTLRLPRDVVGLRLARSVTDPALAAYGVTADCRQDIAIALTEACGNAIKHATPADDFAVTVTIEDGTCEVEVTDSGRGLVLDGPPSPPPAKSQSGRGMHVIAQLADHFEVDSRPGQGTRVSFAKRLEFTADAPATSLADF